MSEFQVPLAYQLNVDRFSEPLGSDMGTMDMHTYAQYKGLSSDERKFLSLMHAGELRSRIFAQDELIFEANKPAIQALLILEGEALWEVSEQPCKLGPGSVVGLAEGLAGLRHLYNLRAISQVRAKTLTLSELVADLESANAGIKGLFRVTLERILESRFNDPARLRPPSYK
jgi:CRP-like cAMP-binding protein